MIILSINAGSSSLKFTGFDMPSEKVLISGVFERIGIDGSFYTIKINGEKIKKEASLNSHEDAVRILTEELINFNVVKSLSEIKGVGHRVVHGGSKYANSLVVDDVVTNTIRELAHLAPLHNPANVMGIEAFKEYIPEAPNVAVFDTGFPQSMPKESYTYAIPYEWTEKYGARKYGFHGISHEYLTEFMKKELGKEDVNLITCHLGNGSSMFSIKDSKAFDTSLGFSTNSGLIMGTRSGDVDTLMVQYLMKETGLSFDEIINVLNKESGLLGVSGVSSDSRDIEDGIKAGNERCILAQKMYVRRIIDYIVKYYFQMDGCDAIIFTAGVGENSIATRASVVEGLHLLGIELDPELNDCRGKETLITTATSKIPCYVIPTNEELMIARDTYELAK